MDPLSLERQSEIDGRYYVELTAWKDAHNVVFNDMTVSQMRRFLAFANANGDIRNAKRMLFARYIFNTGQLSDRGRL